MIEEVAVVVDATKNQVLVETKVKTTCGHCAVKSNCGTSTIAKAFSNKSTIFPIDTNEHLSEGDLVKVGIPESSLVRAAFQVYIIPIIALFSGIYLISVLFPSASEVFQLGFGIICAGFSYKWLQSKYKDSKTDSSIAPIFIEKISKNNKVGNEVSIKYIE